MAGDQVPPESVIDSHRPLEIHARADGVVTDARPPSVLGITSTLKVPFPVSTTVRHAPSTAMLSPFLRPR